MPRPKRPRRISFLPSVSYFKPAGVALGGLEEVRLTVDELEALRLVDLKGWEQEKAARQMKVSQSTLQRILSQARLKVAEALVKGKAIKIKGGEVMMWGFGRGFGRRRGRMGGPLAAGPGGSCVCTNPDCRHEVPHQAGQPCYQMKCPKCGSPMVRKR